MTDTQIDTNRLSQITVLGEGSHTSFDDGLCAMEAVAYIAGEPWSDHPACACPVIAAFMRSWNDGLPSDEDRNRLLLPLVPKLVGTRATPEIEQRRATMAADWLIRTHTVAWLRLAKLDAQADALAALPEITDFAQCPSLMPTLEAVRRDATAARAAAWYAAGAAAGDAAWDAAWAAAWDAVGAAAWDAVGAAAWAAARAAAGDAAWDAARAAAGDAAWDAAWDALKQTTAELQISAVALVERMIAVEAQ
ncbi:hypothetical protein DLM45_02465 [Hyphomicrobium methylovorum]|uniref:hypothetical protein n=1 Tax=Hyphomicrobium methylovorum TaxID=84 RepID=UPI0015E75400|nr:hypothetical protein [Hyphomicrobium methylovorum]MBA2125090.1 hypothetical protein [Hyphomicrobium methylovorum]